MNKIAFNKARRLLKKTEYDFVFTKAKKIKTNELIILYRRNFLQHARLGLALSKHVIPKAHDRNRVKRLLRETFRIKKLPAVDIVILARHGLLDIENKIVIAELDKIWDKLIITSVA